ncbi:MAG: patatin family protein [Lachnospiraceae bacterium]|nr:patatin family protein [Lachnospiraceae bacterium]
MKNKKETVYSKVDELPEGRASDEITEGCLVLEGGAWKGLYTAGVLDSLMKNGINLDTTVGISAGALFGLGYVCGQIGWAAKIDLTYRHSSEYCGLRAMKRDHGITGFSYLYDTLLKMYPMDIRRLKEPGRRFLVGATNMKTGRITYFEKGKCNLKRAIRASATVPYISRPVVIDGIPYLDGGCAEKIPYPWAKENGQKKIVVVKTREWEFRRKEGAPSIAKLLYRGYPQLLQSLEEGGRRFNQMTEELKELDQKGEVFVMAPSKPVTVSRFEGDMEKLGELYWLGYQDMEAKLDQLKSYLKGE